MVECLDQLAISPRGFVFDPRTGATFTVNATGRVLLEGLRDGLGLEGLIGRLRGTFEVDESDLRRDVLEYVRLLKDEGLLAGSFELGSG